nr:MAG TPA: hypothetical protein [Caudoviricetes sp.]DAZ59373.1 MAG TPA: hypothetical protein [Caudoviricetes sp.]
MLFLEVVPIGNGYGFLSRIFGRQGRKPQGSFVDCKAF